MALYASDRKRDIQSRFEERASLDAMRAAVGAVPHLTLAAPLLVKLKVYMGFAAAALYRMLLRSGDF